MPTLIDFETTAKTFKGGVPVMLLPVRIETRFRDKPNGKKELCIRAFPDDIAVNQRNPDFSIDEKAATALFWSAATAPGSTDTSKKEAFRALAKKLGATRAAYVAGVFSPGNPILPMMGGPWTGPSSSVMPDYFVFWAFRTENDASPITMVGSNIPKPLPVGINPSKIADGASPLPAWLTDFDAAVANGMAVATELAPTDAAAGFQRIVALGLRGAAQPQVSLPILNNIFLPHRQSVGLEILPPGTPTNNTAEAPSAFVSNTDPDAVWDAEFGPERYADATDPLLTADGQWIAKALGLTSHIFKRVAGAGSFSRRNASAMNTALWPATVGYFLEEMLNLSQDGRHLLNKAPVAGSADTLSHFDITRTLDRTREFFINHVKGRGALPVLRVGKQPYGILPVGPVTPGPGATGYTGWRDATEDPFEKNLWNLLSVLHTDWRDRANNRAQIPTVDDLGTASPEANFMKILGQHPLSPGLFLRYAMSVESMDDTSWNNYQAWLAFGTKFQSKFFPGVSPWPWELDNPGTPTKEGFNGSDVKLSGLFFKQDAAAVSGFLVDTLPVKANRYLPKHSVQWIPPGQGQKIVMKDLNYIEWLAQPNRNLETLHKSMTQNQHPMPGTSNVLLYVLLRSATFHQHWDAVMRTYEAAGVREGFFNNLTELEWNGLDRDPKFRARFLNPYQFTGKTLTDIYNVDYYRFLNSRATVSSQQDTPLNREDLDRFWMVPPIVRSNYKNLAIGLTKARKDRGLAAFMDQGDMDSLYYLGDSVVPDCRLGMMGYGLDKFGNALLNKKYPQLDSLIRAQGRLPYLFFKFFPDGPLKGFTSGERTGIQYVQDPDLGPKQFPAATTALAEWRTAMNTLAGLPTEELDRLLREHIDLLSHRLDAWYLGLVNKRLAAARTLNPQGIYFGAFGYVENVRPDSSRVNTSYGFVHAPSIDQAVTAAVLRSAYKTTGENNERMGVKLTSARVRSALEVLDGLRAGRTLSGLLAKRFERELGERGLMGFWAFFKNIYKTSEPGIGELVDVQAVVNAYRASYRPPKLADWFKPDNNYSAKEVAPLAEALDRMDDLLDAVADLMLSESVFHLVRGDHNRASASLETLTEGARPPEVEFVRTPRSATALLHRAGAAFAPLVAAAAPPGWPAALTPRALAEPSINHWLGTLLGAPSGYACTASAADAAFARQNVTLNLADLNLQPLDWLHLFSGEWASPEAPLSRLLARAAVDKDNTRLALTDWRFSFQKAGTDEGKAFRRLAVWCARFARTLGQARPLTARDWAHPAAPLPANAPGGTDLAQIQSRVQQARDGLSACRAELDSRTIALGKSLSAGGAQQGVLQRLFAYGQLLDSLRKAALWGIAEAVHPPVTVAFSDKPNADKLLASAASALEHLKKREQEVAAIWPAAGPTTGLSPEALLDTCQRAARAVFGGQFLVVPVFKPIDGGAEVKKALEPNASFLPNRPLVVEDWLHGAARVRTQLAGFEATLQAQSAMAKEAVRDWKLTPFQLPARPNDRWAGAELPSDYFEAHADNETRDKLSLIFWLPPDAPSRTDWAGFVADEWAEAIPAKTQTTGIAMHYNQPNARAPQTILLAVHPSAHDSKSSPVWTAELLRRSVETAIWLAKLRAVDPTHLALEQGNKSIYTQLLPAIVGRVTDPSELPVDAKNQEAEWDFSTDFGVVNDPGAVGFFQPLPFNPGSGGTGNPNNPGGGNTNKQN